MLRSKKTSHGRPLDLDAACGLGLFLASAAIYLAFLSKTYVFEGLARAMPIELNHFRDLFNGNYVLYGFVGWCFHSALSIFVDLTAVTSLQILDALLGAAGVSLFFRIHRKIGFDRASALLGAGVLGSTLGYWRWSTDAEDYIFSTLLLLLNFHMLIDYGEKRRSRPAVLGFAYALAVGGHIVNAAFAPVALWFVIRANPRQWKRPAAEYAASGLVAALAMYGVALAIVHPSNPSDALRWFWGSAASPAGVTFGGGQSPWKIWLWLRTSVHALTSISPAFPAPWSGPFGFFASSVLFPALLWFARLFALILLGRIAFRGRTLPEQDRTIAGGCFLWIGAYALIFTSWQPDTLVYRTTDLPPLCLLLCLSARRLPIPTRSALAVLMSCLFFGNLGAEILPRSDASNNPGLARMDFVRAHTNEGDWVTGGGGRDELYLPFFAQRKPLVVDRFRADPDQILEFARRISKRNESIYVTSTIMRDPFWSGFFRRVKLAPLAADSSGFALYRLKL